MYPVQLEDQIHWIIATISLKIPTMPAHYRTRWSSHSEDMLQVALDDIDWDMFRGEFI